MSEKVDFDSVALSINHGLAKGICCDCNQAPIKRCIVDMSYADGIDWLCDGCAEKWLAGGGYEEWEDNAIC